MPNMKTKNIRPNQAYGLTNPIFAAAQAPVIVGRDPTVNDNAFLGTLWINPVDGNAFIETQIIANQSTWIQVVNGSNNQIVLQDNLNDATGALFEFIKTRLGAAVQNADTLGTIAWFASDGAALLPAAEIRAVVSGAVAPGNIPTSMGFYTDNNLALSINEVQTVTSTDLVSAPGTSACYVTLNVAQPNVTGDGTQFVIPWTASVYDQHGDFQPAFNAFVAPILGVYHVDCQVHMTGVGAAHTFGYLQINGLIGPELNPFAISFAGGQAYLSFSTDIGMALNEHLDISVLVGGGALAVGISNAFTYFTCRLCC